MGCTMLREPTPQVRLTEPGRPIYKGRQSRGICCQLSGEDGNYADFPAGDQSHGQELKNNPLFEKQGVFSKLTPRWGSFLFGHALL